MRAKLMRGYYPKNDLMNNHTLHFQREANKSDYVQKKAQKHNVFGYSHDMLGVRTGRSYALTTFAPRLMDERPPA